MPGGIIDDTLGYSYACRFQRCGLCGLVVNNKDNLACITVCREDMEIEPLRNLPIVRDLCVSGKQPQRQDRTPPKAGSGTVPCLWKVRVPGGCAY